MIEPCIRSGGRWVNKAYVKAVIKKSILEQGRHTEEEADQIAEDTAEANFWYGTENREPDVSTSSC